MKLLPLSEISHLLYFLTKLWICTETLNFWDMNISILKLIESLYQIILV